jgi:hypothetical protein
MSQRWHEFALTGFGVRLRGPVELARDDAPWVAYATGASRDFFAARIGCQVFHPVYGMDLGALCIRGRS